jgi:hypothetical protein
MLGTRVLHDLAFRLIGLGRLDIETGEGGMDVVRQLLSQAHQADLLSEKGELEKTTAREAANASRAAQGWLSTLLLDVLLLTRLLVELGCLDVLVGDAKG